LEPTSSRRRIRILYLSSDLGIPILGRKGASVHVRSMVQAFARAGHEVVVASPILSKSPWEEPATLDVPSLHLPPSEDTQRAVLALKSFAEGLGVSGSLPGELRRILHNPELTAALKHRFENHPPDFIYERATLYGIAGVTLARELRRPLLLELNAPLAVEQAAYRGTGLGDLAERAERYVLHQADAVLTVSAPLRDYVLGLGVAASRVHVIPNGIDPALFHPAPAGASADASPFGPGPVLGFVGGLRPWHGVESLPALLERMIPQHPAAKLVIVGEGPLRQKLEADVERRRLSSSVHFLGAVAHEAVPNLIRRFDLALAPYDPTDHAFYFSPLKLFEYMACGVAVVAARIGQIAEVIEDGETGLLYPPGDLEGLAAACRKLLGDGPLRARLGSAAAARVHAHHTWSHNAARSVEIASTLDGRRE
jgi:glycosyltransferase involved in cell wall biosynthesis